MPRRTMVSLLSFLALLLAACGTPAASTAPAATTAAPAATTAAPAATTAPAASDAAPRKVALAFSFVPNVQFAPYYVAAEKGYYRDEGLDVAFDYNFENDATQRVAAGTVDFAMISGNSVLLARGNGLPVKMIFTVNQRFPVVLFSKKEAGIVKPEDLKGRQVGIPGAYGASFIGLQALLYASNMKLADVQLNEIGYTQLEAVSQDRVEVATGYAMNEPLVLAAQGVDVNVITIADYFPLASDGVIASEKLLASEPDVAQRFTRATLKGLQATIDNPDEAFTISLKYIPELKGDPALQRKVLQNSLPFWATEQTKRYGIGYNDPESWQRTYQFLRDSGLLATELKPEDGFTNSFITAK